MTHDRQMVCFLASNFERMPSAALLEFRDPIALLVVDPDKIPEAPSDMRDEDEEKYDLRDSKREDSPARTHELVLKSVNSYT